MGPDAPLFRHARHVLHLGVDGLDPCFVDAPGGAPNIQQRLGELGDCIPCIIIHSRHCVRGRLSQWQIHRVLHGIMEGSQILCVDIINRKHL